MLLPCYTYVCARLCVMAVVAGRSVSKQDLQHSGCRYRNAALVFSQERLSRVFLYVARRADAAQALVDEENQQQATAARAAAEGERNAAQEALALEREATAAARADAVAFSDAQQELRKLARVQRELDSSAVRRLSSCPQLIQLSAMDACCSLYATASMQSTVAQS